MRKKIFVFYIIFLGFTYSGKAQTLNPDSIMSKFEEFGQFLLYRNHDSTYIFTFADKLTLKLIGITKFHYFKIKDKNNDSSIRYRPDRRLNLGVGVAYKWFALDLAFNFGIKENSGFENTKYFDFQGTIFSSKQFMSGSYQYYYGYQMSNFSGLPLDDIPVDKNRDDIRTVSLTLSYLFALNYDKFSLKASFINNEMQRKSAGSFLIGAQFHLINMDADSSIVASLSQGYFNENLHLNSVTNSSVLINFGYMYTFVWRENFYITLGIIPGIGLNIGDYKTEIKKPMNSIFTGSWSTMNAIGYNSKKVFGGIQLINDAYYFRLDKNEVLTHGYGKMKLYVGYRF